MAYTSLQALLNRFGERMLIQLTDRSQPPADAIDETVVASTIADTDAEIDGYLAGRYALPLESTPPKIADLALAICIYKLHTYEPDPKIREDYKRALRDLELIAAGTIRLPIAGIEPAATGGSGVITNDRQRPLTEENLKGFI